MIMLTSIGNVHPIDAINAVRSKYPIGKVKMVLFKEGIEIFKNDFYEQGDMSFAFYHA